MTPEKLIAKYPPEIVRTASALRKFLLTHLKGIVEQPDTAANVIGYNYGTGYKDLICTLMLSKTGPKLGFYKGAELPDPEKLLTGTGKVHRFVVIKDEADISRPALLQLLQAAIAARQKRLS